MYYCKECGRTFEEPHDYVERHGFASGPFESWSVCPYCGEPGYVLAVECQLDDEMEDE